MTTSADYLEIQRWGVFPLRRRRGEYFIAACMRWRESDYFAVGNAKPVTDLAQLDAQEGRLNGRAGSAPYTVRPSGEWC